MTVKIEGRSSVFLADRAFLIQQDRELAWAEKYVTPNKALSYVVGRYAEADKANHNRQFWTLNGLRMGQPTIAHSPMNMLHSPRAVVGAFIATEMVYPMAASEPQAQEAAYEYDNPYVEALGVMWKYYFPEEYKLVESAHANGSLFFSMEAIANTLTCAGDQGCQKEFAYDGPVSNTYCDCLNQGPGVKQMNQPHFLGGALIIPPAKPGWAGADIRELSQLVKEHQVEAEAAYDGLKVEAAHLDEPELESLTHQVLLLATRFPVGAEHV